MLSLIRYKATEDAILGKLYLNGSIVCYTLEKKSKAIGCGFYIVENSMSPNFKRELPLIYNKTDLKASRGIRIHCGNSVKDTEGCVLVGMGIDDDLEKLKESKMAENMVTALCRFQTSICISEV